MNQINRSYYYQARKNMIENIKKSRIPLPQLAKTAGISISTLRDLMNEKTIIRTQTMIQLSRALNMTTDDFLGMKNL